MTSPTRRELLGQIGEGAILASVASGGVALAGCASFGSDDPAPVDVDGDELDAIAAVEVPEVRQEFPVDIADEHVGTHRSRAETLLDAVPPDFGDIPNEAVRNYIETQRDRARDELNSADDAQSNRATLSSLQSAREHAATAEGAHAAARGQRVRGDVYDGIEPVQARLSTLETGLVRVGDVPHHAVLVYEDVEDRFDSAQRSLERVDNAHPVTSEVRAVGRATGQLESARAELGVVDHILERQPGERTFDDDFERVARDLLEDVGDRTDVLPSDRDDAGDELFDARVSDTPRERIAREVFFWGQLTNAEDVETHIEGGRFANALLALYRLDHLLRTVDRLQARVADGAYDRPDDGAAVRSAKETAVAEIESVLEGADYPLLVQRGIQTALSSVAEADHAIEEERYPPDLAAVVVTGNYALAAERARALPASTEWFVEQLP